MILLIILSHPIGCDSIYLCNCATHVSLFSVCSFFAFIYLLLLFSTYSSQGKRSVLEQVSVSNIVVPEKNISDTNTLPDSGHVALEVVMVTPPPQRLFDAEVPIWKELEGRSGKDDGENSANKVAKPLCGG